MTADINDIRSNGADRRSARTRRTARASRGREPAAGATSLTREELNTRWKLARMLVESGYLDGEVRSPEQALFVILKGEELGLPPVQALTSINVIEGTPALSGALLMALCIRDADCRFEVERREGDGAAVTIHRPGWRPYTAEFTEEDADRAGLLEDEYWERYPKAMHFWRAVAEAARTVCPDVVAGLYTPEELGEAEASGTPPEPAAGEDGDRSAGNSEALAERYRQLWAGLLPEEERRVAVRRQFEADHPRLPEDREAWGRTEYAVAIRTVEEAGPDIVRDFAEEGEAS